MKAKTVFVARLNDGTDKFPFVPVTIKRDHPVPNPKYSSFYARYTGKRKDGSRGRVVQPLVSTKIEEAYVEFLNVETAQKQVRSGQAITMPDAPAAIAGETPLKNAIDEYLASCKVRNAKDTYDSKTRILNSFRDLCFANGVTTVEALKDAKTGRKLLIAYLGWMQENLKTVEVDGARPENTWHERMRKLGAFLRQQGIKIKKEMNSSPDDPGLLAHHEFPKLKAKVAVKYSDEMVQLWLKAATVDEADLIWFFLATGFRDEEAAHCEWSDINFRDKSINIHAKAKTAARPWSWSPKDGESRSIDIPLPDDFIKRMEARKTRYASRKCSLIFPSGVCRPNKNMLRIAKCAARRAGIVDQIGFHPIRKTFASYIAKKYGIEMARQLLGHSKIQTTQIYLSADAADVREMKASVNDMTAAFTGK